MRICVRFLQVLSLVIGLFFLVGCQLPTPSSGATPAGTMSPQAGLTPGGSPTPDPVVFTTPGSVKSTDVKVGTGASADGAAALSVSLRVWKDKFDGKPFGSGQSQLMLVEGATPLPGLLKALKGMKKEGVRRLEIAAIDLFGEIPPGAPVQPNEAFFVEATLKDVFAKEPFDITTVKPGTGSKQAEKGDAIRVHYVGRLGGFDSKTIFDSSRERKEPFVIKLGEGRVIPGWEQGLLGMKKGEVRRLSIPHYLAYGDEAHGDKIPAKSRLFFEVELLDFVAPGKLVEKTIKPGAGQAIAAGEIGRFHYTGWLDGFEGKKKFDSSRDRQAPFTLTLGAGQVIPGWDQGLLGMKPGEVRRLEIPYNLAYGEGGRPPQIPPYQTLYFEVEYLGLAKPDASPSPTP